MINRKRTTREVLVLTSTDAERHDDAKGQRGLEEALRRAFPEWSAGGAPRVETASEKEGAATGNKTPDTKPAHPISKAPVLDRRS